MLYFVFGGLGRNINYIIQLLITLGKFCKSQWIHPKPCFHSFAVWYVQSNIQRTKKAIETTDILKGAPLII